MIKKYEIEGKKRRNKVKSFRTWNEIEINRNLVNSKKRFEWIFFFLPN